MSNLMLPIKDIHMPSPVGLWPLAPGWYFVIFFMIVFGIFLVMKSLKLCRRKKYKKSILAQVDALERRVLKGMEARSAIADLSILLKRLALSHFADQNPGALSGQHWLDFLNRTGKCDLFTKDVGEIIFKSMYQKDVKLSTDDFFHAAKVWVKVVL
jgi:hypothetical protein